MRVLSGCLCCRFGEVTAQLRAVCWARVAAGLLHVDLMFGGSITSGWLMCSVFVNLCAGCWGLLLSCLAGITALLMAVDIASW